MLAFDNWLFSAALFPIWVGSAVLMLKRGKYYLARNLLGIAFLISSWFMILFIVVESNLLLQYPWMFRIGMPFYYLIPPFIYFYVYTVFTDQPILKRSNLLHLIPFLLALIDVSKYIFGSDIADKMAEIYRIKENRLIIFELGSGFVPAIIHYYGRMIQSIIYLALQWKLMMKCFSLKTGYAKHKWLLLLTFSETVMYVGNACFTIGVFYRTEIEPSNWFLHAYYPVCYAMLLALFSAVIYLLFNPRWLHGRKFKSLPPAVKVLTQEQVQAVDKKEKNLKYALLKEIELLHYSGFGIHLNEYLEGQKNYLRKRLTIKDMASELNLSHHLLSAFINHYYECNFNEFINHYRIDHIIENIKNNPSWKQFSIEGLASEAGFSSRSAFYLAFKNKTGLSPATYIFNQENEEIEPSYC